MAQNGFIQKSVNFHHKRKLLETDFQSVENLTGLDIKDDISNSNGHSMDSDTSSQHGQKSDIYKPCRKKQQALQVFTNGFTLFTSCGHPQLILYELMCLGKMILTPVTSSSQRSGKSSNKKQIHSCCFAVPVMLPSPEQWPQCRKY